MSNYKDQCIEVEEKFASYLNNDGMTNQQAIVAISKEYGHAHAFACATLLEEWNAEDKYTDNVYHLNTSEDVKYPNKKKVRSS